MAKRTDEKSSTVGNTSAMREALETARDLLLPQCNGGTAFAKACGETVNKIMDALSAPPRNCDVGTAEEQAERMDAYCASHGELIGCGWCCDNCPLRSIARCDLVWAQMSCY